MKAILSLIISGALVVSSFGQTRNVLVNTNNAVVQPTNFWSADASNARAGLGLGSAATNPASAFQPSSLALSNLNANNGGSLTNLTASSVVGTLSLGQGGTGSTNAVDARTALGLGTAATNPASAFQASSANLTNLAANNGGSLTNLQATSLVGVIPASNIATVNFTNIGGTLSIASGGTGATNAANARQNLGSTTVGDAVFIATNAEAARTAIGALGANSNGASLTNLTAANITGTVALASNVTGTIAISNGGSGATTAGGARTNLELGSTNAVSFGPITAQGDVTIGSPNISFDGVQKINLEEKRLLNGEWQLEGPLGFNGTNISLYQAQTRTNLELGWSALTNTTASGFKTALFGTGTNPVLVNTNGEVISPTNFWQAAPITTTFIESQPTTNSSTNISPSRLLHIHSLATNIVNTTNTIVLPTNTLTFEGDIAMVVHKGPTNSLTQVRQDGSTNNLITLNKFNEAVEFTYYNDTWQFLETVAFTAPIYFSGTNAAANAAASRTNLGLGASDVVSFDTVNTISGLRVFSGTNLVTYIGEDISEFETPLYVGNEIGISFSTNNNAAATTRTNLGLGATNIVTFAGITNNGDITINQTSTNNGLLYIYRTNAEPFLGLANLIASNNTTISNETLFRVGVSEATNKAAQFGFRSTNTNGNGVAVFSVFGYNALMMVGPSDPNAGTNPIQATVYSIAPTNKVMTLITTNTGATLFHRAIEFENTTNQAVTRTNLGLPLAALTNTSVTNFQKAIFYTNTAPSNIGGNLGTIAAWIEIVASNGVTYKIPAYTNVP